MKRTFERQGYNKEKDQAIKAKDKDFKLAPRESLRTRTRIGLTSLIII